jgi:hypothetical protein
MVPPVVPRPRPESLATGAPQAATIGREVREILSPTPPVECLSTQQGNEYRLPESAIASVSASVSWYTIPWMKIAMRSADI